MDAKTESRVEATTDGKLTLAIDIGGTGLKTGLLDVSGKMIGGPVRVDTPHPADPDVVVDALVELANRLGQFDRISVGFPGVVRAGRVLTAPNLGTSAWHNFQLGATLSKRLDKPVRVLNDATVQGLGVITGHGLECVITLGTGMGFALFQAGGLTPHLELAHHPVRTDKDYDAYIGNAALEKIGRKRWNKRVRKAIGHIQALVNYDTLAIGGGNAKHLQDDLPPHVRVVSNQAGITGGVRLWDPKLDSDFDDEEDVTG
jgi:polyphosphate glucokinase